MLPRFLNAVSSVLVILLLTSVGYFLASRGKMAKSHKAFLNDLIMNILVPANCIYGLSANLSRSLFREYGKYSLVSLIGCAVLFALAFLAAKLLKLPRRRMGMFIMMGGVSNAIFVGYAMCREFFGEVCTPYVMLYYLINTTSIWVGCTALLRWSFGTQGDGLKAALKKIITTPSILAIFAGLALVVTDVPLPAAVGSFLKYLSNCLTPIALIVTGFIIYDIGLKSLKMSRDVALLLCFRFLLTPLVFWVLFHLMELSGIGVSVLMVEATMPSPTVTVVMASAYGQAEDEAYASQGVIWTTLATFAVTPALMMLVG